MTARREKLIGALLSEPSIERAASKAGISERTARRWLADRASWRQNRVRTGTSAQSLPT